LLVTGETVHKRSLELGDGRRPGRYKARVLGIVNGVVYACVRHFAGPPPAALGRGQMRVSHGPEPGHLELIAFAMDDPALKSIGPLPNTAGVADRLLGTRLVYTEGRTLNVLPLDGGERRSFALPADAILRPRTGRGEVFGLFEGGAYVYRPGQPDLVTVAFRDTPLETFTKEDSIAKAGDLLVAALGGEVVACDLAGKLRWKVPIGGWVATGPGGEICAFGERVRRGWGMIYRLAREDGRIMWKAYLPPWQWWANSSSVHGTAILGGRLVLLAEKGVYVYDVETGRLTINLPHDREVDRGYSIFAVLVRMSLAGNVLVVGFEDHVFGVDLTPTAEVPARCQAGDPANAMSDLAEFMKRRDKGQQRNRKLAMIGHNLADTPEVAPEVVSLVRRSISGGASPDVALLGGFHWLDDRALLPAMARFAKGHKEGWRTRIVVGMIAGRPESDKVLPILRGIAADTTYPSHVRSVAATQLRLSGRRPRISRADLELLFLSDRKAASAEFRRRLRDGDAKVRAAALELLGMAPDAVIVGLDPEFAKLPEGEQAQGRKLVAEAKARLGAIAGFGDRD